MSKWLVFLVALIIAAAFALVFGLRSARQEPVEFPRSPEPTEGSAPTEEAWFEAGSVDRTLALEGAQRLRIENRFGDIEVVPAGREVRAVATVRARATDEAAAQTKAGRIDLTVSRQPEGELGLAVAGVPEDPGMDVQVTVRAPAGLPLVVRTAAGGASVEGIRAPVSVQSDGGDISVADAEGPVTIETETGRVSATSIAAGVTANAGGGEIALTDVHGPVLVRTMSGRIWLREVAAREITATTRTADIDIALSEPFSGRMEARTDSGTITMALPRSSNCTVKTTTGSGDISSELALEEAVQAGPNISGRLGAGAGSVTISTRSGDIRLVEAD